MYISPPDCKVINLGVKFNHLKINGKRGIIDLTGQKPYVVLAGQPGMLFGKGNRDVAHAPAALQAGGRPRYADDSVVEDIKLPPIEQNEQYPLKQLIIILDRSSSMKHRLELVQQQIADLSPHLSKLHGLKISLVSFDENGKKEITYVDSFGQVVKKVSEIQLGSGTDIAEGLKFAKEVLTGFDDYDPSSTDRNLCVFITDGQTKTSTLEDVFPLTNQIANLGNSIFVVSGVGTAYSPAVNREMAGVACSGAWAHIASSVGDKALKKLGESDFFGKFLPRLLRQITGNDYFIRVDANGVDRAWCVEPSVFENKLPTEVQGTGIQELGPSIWTYPSYVCFAKGNEPEFWVTSQEKIAHDPDNEQTQSVEIVNFDDLIDPELRLRTIFAMRKFFLSLCLQQEAPEFLAGLRNIGLIRRDQFQRYYQLLERAEQGGEGDREQLYEESSSSGNESIGSFGGMEAELERMLGDGASEGVEGYNLTQALADLEKKLGGGASDADPASSDQDEPQGNQPHRTQVGGGFEGHSGGLGGLDDPPLASVGAFQGGAVEAYNQVQSPNVNFGITNSTKEVVIKGGLDLRQLSKITVGRQPKDCQIVVSADGASRQHCEITRRGDNFFIRDLGSRNGTYLNGNQITSEVPLNNDDLVSIANQSFRVVIGDIPVAEAVLPKDQVEQPDPNAPVGKTFAAGTPGTKINLKYNSDKVTVKAGAFDKSKITVGRHPDNDVIINAEGASRFHCHIEKKDECFELKDLGSRNGTKVNQKLIAQTLLNNGDIITVAGIDFTVEIS